jgi:hypothetical protein
MSKKLDKAALCQLFDVITSDLAAKPAEVAVEALRLGDEIEGEWVPLLGLSYDPHDDSVAIALRGIDITIPKPRELYFDGVGGEWASLDIIDADGLQHNLELKEALPLPALQSHTG